MNLCDWSETLSFEEIEDTLFLVGLYLNKDYSRFTQEGLKKMESFVKRNDLKKFAEAHNAALDVQEQLEDDLAYAQDIMSMPCKIPMSH